MRLGIVFGLGCIVLGIMLFLLDRILGKSSVVVALVPSLVGLGTILGTIVIGRESKSG